ncbi:hypothetical protein K440DRAFT_593109 [Wilcoxina mikolae CBS 423.85]|nr:hypothetical protein K440DRAFT_593109 [Wilcoxina mikolae CBS 423.85]
MPAAVQPLISIKAGKCNQDGTTIMPCPEPGILYVYLPPDEDLHRFCWKPRDAVEPEVDLMIIPGDARLQRYDSGPTGRIFVLKFGSSSQRQFYWLQSQSEGPNKEPGYWSERDKNWIKRIDKIWRGDEGDDEEMGDAPIDSGNIEHEGEQPRRGGEDGGRAPPPQFDFASLLSQIQIPGSAQAGQALQQVPTISLHDLLSTANTAPLLENMSEQTIDSLISNLPPAIIPKNASLGKKKQIISKVLRSPQFTQGAISLTVALREGALRGVADSLKVPILPGEEATGADQVEIFVKGVKREVEDGGSSS